MIASIFFTTVDIVDSDLRTALATIGLAISILTLSPLETRAEVVFPGDAGVVDVTRPPYNADPSGKRDSTRAIQKVLDDHPSGNRIIYLPNGEYLISDTLRWPEGRNEGAFMKRTVLQGQSRSGTVIRLQDHSEGFGEGGVYGERWDRPEGKAMLWTGRAPAQRFRNAVRDLTLDTGSGNPGAIGARFKTNNQGGVFNVTIRSGDGQGRVGLDLGYAHEIGPLLVKDLRVEGFDYGIHSWGAVNSITMVNVELHHQNQAGIRNFQQVLSIENLVSRNRVPALVNRVGYGVVTLIGADLRAPGEKSEAAAIDNHGVLYARNITVDGYQQAIANHTGTEEDAAGPEVAEFVSHPPLAFANASGPLSALHLPIRHPPEIPWDPLDQWASPLEFGGSPENQGDDTAALQQAIDSGATTVYLPNGTWNLKGNLYVRGRVRRIIGCEARLTGDAIIHIVDGEAPAVRIERLEILPIAELSTRIVHTSPRTLVLANMRMSRRGAYAAEEGAGDLFIEDVAGDPWHFAPGQNIWARQLNPEGSMLLVNRHANLWILGLKTEGNGPILEASGGATEILGSLIYANTRREKNDLFILRDQARFSVTMGEASFRNFPFRRLAVQYIDDEEMQVLERGRTPTRGGGSALPLFVVPGP
ncbi:MAG: glycosyl hydrolase family 28-related protein [Kiritimatiellia bacterium]